MGELTRRPAPTSAVPHQGERAGLVSRCLADLIDAGLLAAIGLAVMLVVSLVRYLWVSPRFSIPVLPNWLVVLLGLGAMLVYLAYFWSTTGRTPGKQLLGLRVVDRAGLRLSARRALLRAALCIAFPPGLMWIVVSRENASAQDLVVRSKVVYDWNYRL